MNAVARHGVSIALACRAFEISETCYRYSPVLSDENEEIANWLERLTANKRSWGFGLCFFCTCATFKAMAGYCHPAVHVYMHERAQTRLPDLLRVGTELEDQAQEAPQAGQTRCAGSAGYSQSYVVNGFYGGSTC